MDNAMCEKCGADKMEGGKFCPYCGAEFAEVYARPSASEPVKEAPLTYQRPAPIPAPAPSRSRGTAVIVIAIIVAAVIISAAILLAASNSSNTSGEIKNGDYILYNYTVTSGSAYGTGTMRMGFSNVTSAGLSITYVYMSSSGTKTTSTQDFTYVNGELTATSDNSSGNTTHVTRYVGETSISTTFGTEDVYHYLTTYSDNSTMDEYDQVDSGLPVRMTYVSGAYVMQMDVSKTNMDWAFSTTSSGSDSTMTIAIAVVVALLIVAIAVFAVWSRNRAASGPGSYARIDERTGQMQQVCPVCGTVNEGTFCRICGRRLG